MFFLSRLACAMSDGNGLQNKIRFFEEMPGLVMKFNSLMKSNMSCHVERCKASIVK